MDASLDSVFSGFAVLLFAAVTCLVEGALLWWSSNHGRGARRIARRLRLMSGHPGGGAELPGIVKQRRYAGAPALDRLLRRLPAMAVLDRLLLQAGARWEVARLLGAVGALLLAALLLPPLLAWPPVAWGGAVLAAAAAPPMLLLRRRAARLHRAEQQLPELADFLSRALRAGHSFANVLHMAGDEVPEPLGSEFRLAWQEINFGAPMHEALHNLAARIPLTDLRYLVIAVLIQRESGGNLAELLDNVSRMTRARLKLLGHVRVLSAEGRMSAWVLGLLPLGVLALMLLTNPKYVAPLWQDPLGRQLVGYALAGVAGGVLWMRSVIRIRV